MKCESRHIVSVLLCFLMLICVTPTAVLGRDLVETNRSVSLTLEYGRADAEFSLYRVGSISESGEISLNEDLRNKYQVTLATDQEGWAALAKTLAPYAQRDQWSPAASGKTDAGGKLVFSSLRVGLYLVVGAPLKAEKTTYTPQPFIICLPNLENEKSPWIYDVTAKPKYEETTDPDETAAYKVLKVWKNSNGVSQPKSVQVELLKDGSVYDTVTLNAENNWRHTWENLSVDSDWAVVEKEVPQGYTVSTVLENKTFVITNTAKSTGDTSESTKPSKLPQTGMLWWPVGILASAGLVLFLLGWIRRQNSHEKE